MRAVVSIGFFSIAFVLYACGKKEIKRDSVVHADEFLSKKESADPCILFIQSMESSKNLDPQGYRTFDFTTGKWNDSAPSDNIISYSCSKGKADNVLSDPVLGKCKNAWEYDSPSNVWKNAKVEGGLPSCTRPDAIPTGEYSFEKRGKFLVSTAKTIGVVVPCADQCSIRLDVIFKSIDANQIKCDKDEILAAGSLKGVAADLSVVVENIPLENGLFSGHASLAGDAVLHFDNGKIVACKQPSMFLWSNIADDYR